MNKLFTKIVGVALGLTMAIGIGVAIGNNREAVPVHAADTTYTFTSKSWADSTSSWTSDKDGLALTSGQGVQVTAGDSGAGAHTGSAINNITAIEFTYCTNSKKGVGSISVTIGSNTAVTYSVTKTGGTTARPTSHTYSTAQSGVVTFSVTCTTNSVYVAAIKITTQNTIPTTSVDVSPESVTLAPGGTQQLTTTVLPANTTDTLSYSSNANGVATVSSSGLITAHADGTATITATSGNYSDTCVVTVETPTTPFIEPAKSSTSGYTGQNETLSFTYGNLTSTLGVSSSNTSVVTVGSPSTSAGSGTVQLNFVGAGSTTVKFLEGSTERASVDVSVTASSVSITGLAATSTAYIGKTLNLGSTVNVTATGIYSNAVTWESEDDDIAIVSATGVVTGVAEGTVDITVTSDDYPSAHMTCTVTVEEVPLETTYDFRTKFGTYAKDWGNSYTSKTVQGVKDVGGDYAATITFALATKQTGTITTMPVVADQASGDVVHVTFELTESGYELGNVSVTFAQWSTRTPTMKLFKGDSATGTVLDSGVVGTKNTISATDVGGTKFVVAMNDNSTSRNQVGIQSIYITLKAAPVLSSVTTSGQKTTFEYGDTFSYGGTLTAHYTQGKADATVSPSKFKYGATSSFNADSSGTEITVGAALSHATHDGVYVRVGYSEDSGVTYKWTDAYQISVEDAPSYYMVLDAYTDTGTDYGYKGGVIEIDVTESNLAGNINWSVTAGSVSDASGDNSSYLATIMSVGTLTITATDSGDPSNTRSVSFTIIDSLNTVMAASETPHASILTFTAEAEGSGTADDDATYTVTSDAAESTYEEARGIHFGTNSSATVQYVQLSSSNVASGNNDVIKSVVVNASDAQSEGNTASLTVTVGGESFHCSGSATATLGGQATYTFTGSGSGTVVIRAERSEANYKGIYFKSVVVNYVTTGAESNIANAVNMHLAQKAVIDYAKDFNDTLEGICVAYGSTDASELKDAWDDLATQYTSWFTNTGKSLTSEEKAHAKALFANASSVDRNVTASADELQHMLAKYDWIVGHYSNCGDFLNTDAGTGRDPVPEVSNRVILNNIMQNGNTVAIIVVISMISVTCIGGYFFLRKRKED